MESLEFWTHTLACLSFFLYSFTYLWLCWIFIAACGISLVVGSGDDCLVEEHGLLIVVACLISIKGSRHAGFSHCGTRA